MKNSYSSILLSLMPYYLYSWQHFQIRHTYPLLSYKTIYWSLKCTGQWPGVICAGLFVFIWQLFKCPC